MLILIMKYFIVILFTIYRLFFVILIVDNINCKIMILIKYFSVFSEILRNFPAVTRVLAPIMRGA